MTKIKKYIKNYFEKKGYGIGRIAVNDEKTYLKYFSEDSIKNKRFYNIGAGRFRHPFWTNMDHDSDWYVLNKENTLSGIPYDLLSLSPMSIDSDSAEIFYTSHTMEHIPDSAAEYLFGEIHRTLKKDGIFRLTCPDMDLAYRALQNNDLHFFQQFIQVGSKIIGGTEFINYKIKHSIEQYFLCHIATYCSSITNYKGKKLTDEETRKILSEKDNKSAFDYFTSLCSLDVHRKYPGNHINWWNKEKFFDKLKKAGFTKVFLSGYGQSSSPVLRNTYYFDNTHPENSIYIEAIK